MNVPLDWGASSGSSSLLANINMSYWDIAMIPAWLLLTRAARIICVHGPFSCSNARRRLAEKMSTVTTKLVRTRVRFVYNQSSDKWTFSIAHWIQKSANDHIGAASILYSRRICNVVAVAVEIKQHLMSLVDSHFDSSAWRWQVSATTAKRKSDFGDISQH